MLDGSRHNIIISDRPEGKALWLKVRFLPLRKSLCCITESFSYYIKQTRCCVSLHGSVCHWASFSMPFFPSTPENGPQRGERGVNNPAPHQIPSCGHLISNCPEYRPVDGRFTRLSPTFAQWTHKLFKQVKGSPDARQFFIGSSSEETLKWQNCWYGARTAIVTTWSLVKVCPPWRHTCHDL